MDIGNRKERIALIRSIEEKRGTRVITYITSDRPNLHYPISPDIVPIIHDQILSLPADQRKNIDLFLYTRGGNSDVPWTIVSMLREYSVAGGFSLLVPFRCHSAGTMIALGADEIIMTKKGELGPIDITMNGPHNPKDSIGRNLPMSVEDVMGYFDLIKNQKNEDEESYAALAFNLISSQVSPIALGAVNRSYNQTRLVAERLLETRTDPYDDKQINKITEIVSSDIYSHHHAIHRTEARDKVGILHVVNSEDAKIDKEMWALYEKYAELFEFENMIDVEAHMVENDLNEYDIDDVPMVCVESNEWFNLKTIDMKYRCVRKTPPEISLNLQNFQPPQVNIPNLPQEITQQNLVKLVDRITSQVIQQSLNQAARAAADQYMRSVPIEGISQNRYNEKWVTIEGEG